MEPIRIAPATLDHSRGSKPGCHADQNALLGTPELLQAMPFEVALELPIHDVGCQKQGELPQLG